MPENAPALSNRYHLKDGEVMISLNDIKVAAFDFDNTLAIHREKKFMSSRAGDEDSYFLGAYADPEHFYDVEEPCTENEELKKLISLCRERGIAMYCVTGMRTTMNCKAKDCYIRKHYGEGIEVIATAGQERKKDVVRILTRHLQIKPEEMLFVDDLEATLDMLKETGVRGVHVSQIGALLAEQ